MTPASIPQVGDRRLPSRWSWVPGALAAVLLGSIVLSLLGTPVAPAVLLSSAVVLQVLAGMVVWLAVIGPPSGRERDRLLVIGMGSAIGMGLAVVAGVLVHALMPGVPGWLLPIVLAAGAWFWPGSRVIGVDRGSWQRPSVIAGLVGIGTGVGGVALNLSQYPLSWTGDWSGYHRDMVFFEALSTSIARFGPLDSIFMSGAEIRYHWLGYAWAGQLAETFGTAPFLTLTRVLPVAALVAVMALVASWAAARSSGWRVPVLAVLLISAGGYVGAINGTILNFDSPSESIAAAWLLALVIAFLAALDRDRLRWPMVLVVGLLGAILTGGKISAAAVGLAGMGLVAVVLLVRRDSRARRAWLLLAAAAGGFVAAFLLLIAGTATGGTLQVLSVQARAAYVQGLIWDRSPVGIVAGTASLILAMAARWWGLLWSVGARVSRWQVETVLGVGLVIASVIPVIVLSEGVSETWFGLVASAPLAVLSAVGLGAAWQRIQGRLALALSLIAALPVVLVVSFLWAQGEPTTASARFWGPPLAYALAIGAGAVVAVGARAQAPRHLVWIASSLTVIVVAGALSRAVPVVATAMPKVTYLTGPIGNIGAEWYVPDGAGAGPLPAQVLASVGLPPDRTSWSDQHAEAGQVLFASTSGEDILVTNDNTSFLVPALGQRLTYMSGAPYQWQYGSATTVGGIPERVAVSQAFVDSADPQAFATLCAAGVTWMWVDHGLTDRRDWAPFATVEFANDDVTLAQLERSLCP
jgi:hypothetical protein